MKKNFQEQFNSLKTIISSNVKTLRELISQADSLSNIISKLDVTNDDNKQLKKSLEEIKSNISKSIDELVNHTQKLFDAYDKLIDEVFKK